MRISEKAAKIKPSSTLAISAMAKKMKQQGKDVISFGAGEPDFDTPEHIKAAAVTALKNGFTKYTASSGIEPLREAIAKKLAEENGLSFTPAQIVVSNGAKHALSNIFTAVLNSGDEVVIPAPYWLSYPEMVTIAGGVPVIVDTAKENAYKMTAGDLERAVTPKTKAIILNSPNNPTGSVYSAEELADIGKVCTERDLLIISDEIYEYLIYDDNVRAVSIASLSEDLLNRTVIVNGFSKSYSMTGWRVGYTASSREIADAIGNIQSHCASNANSIAQMAALEALNGGNESIETMKKSFVERRALIFDEISKISQISVIKPAGAFYIFADVSALTGKTVNGVLINSAKEFSETLLAETGISVIPCNDFGAPNHVRLTFTVTPDEIVKGIGKISEFVKKYY